MDANRELLLEFCIARDMRVANTFIDVDVENQVTFHDIWQNPVAGITHNGFAQLDLVLCHQDDLW